MEKKYLMDLHTHTVASVHAYSSLRENALAARERGLEILGTSDHGYGMKNTTGKTFWKNVTIIPDYIEGVRVLVGMEANLHNSKGDLMEEDVLDRVDYVIASIHKHCYETDTEDMDDYTAGVINCLDRFPQVNILGHPDNGTYPLDYEEVVKACKRNNVAVELNCSSLLPDTYRLNPRENLKTCLSLCKQYQVPVIVNSDAHFCDLVGDFAKADELLDEMDFPEDLVVNFSWERLESLLGREI